MAVISSAAPGPRRVQRRRRRGWRMPDRAVYVGRPTIWGNPFRITRSSEFHGLPGSWFLVGEDDSMHHPDEDTERSARRKAVDLYADLVLRNDARVGPDRIRAELAGHDLVCWCPADQPCHADFLLEVANAPAPARVPVMGSSSASCPRCGQPGQSGSAPTSRGDGDVSVTGVPQRLRCQACGHLYETGTG